MTTWTKLLLLAIAVVVAVLIVGVALYLDSRRSPYRPSGGPPSPVVRAAALFIIVTIYNGLWFGVVQLLHALFGPF
ncbi:hypothetical protein ACR9E3_09530 [Actinomycetospora sp. C-140]